MPPASPSQVPQTHAEKVALFRSLFRGRADVFPVRFVSRKTGRAGYAPACSNKWEPQLCLLRTGGRCSDCVNQAFVPVGDRIVIDHLQGRHVMGVYPLLDNETCWFLAVDFDKSSWREDATAFVETCGSVGTPVAIERSRSGNGAHVWFFFSTPIAANVARRIGCYLITETMSRRHELSMGSYDRLFPNQDTMPRGGFGNLIALPLQYEARQQGNSVFVDDQLNPIADQWAFLASVQRIQPGAAEMIAREATRTGQVIGARLFEDLDDEGSVSPWKRLPSGRTAVVQMPISLPSNVGAVLAQRLFIEKAGLPPPMLNLLKRLAAFQNPEFYKKQRMRLSTAMTPRVIACAEDLPQHVSLPRGCVSQARQLLEEHGVTLTVEDQRHEGAPLELTFGGQLTVFQKEMAQAVLAHDTGVLVAPPGIGKTVLGTYLIAQRARSTLILVHRRPLLEQWIAQLAIFLGIDEKQVGRIGGGQRRPNGRLDVAMVQSLVRRNQVDDVVAGYGHVIVDECHHMPAVSFERLLSEVKAVYAVGLTATPQRRDGHQPITEMQLGPIRYQLDQRSQAVDRPFGHKLIVRETGFRMTGDGQGSGIQKIYRVLANDDGRNLRIVEDVIAAIHEGRSPILLTERVAHLQILAERLRGFVRHLVVLRGGMTMKERRHAADQLASIPATAERLIL
ncbi:MAG: TOTE conflict system archaeo-eukaryotic primase domain-containing protein, partial [Burkholderiales bacterium]